MLVTRAGSPKRVPRTGETAAAKDGSLREERRQMGDRPLRRRHGEVRESESEARPFREARCTAQKRTIIHPELDEKCSSLITKFCLILVRPVQPLYPRRA
jgi:hypothetical protein